MYENALKNNFVFLIIYLLLHCTFEPKVRKDFEPEGKNMRKNKWIGLMVWIMMSLFEEAGAVCPKLTYAKVYEIFSSAEAQNFKKEKTTFGKFLAFFLVGDPSEDTGPLESTFMVADVQIGDQYYKMVSRDDLSRLKDGGERTVFGGGRAPNRDTTSFAAYSDSFQGDHCAYALAYGPGNQGGGLDMLRFELYLKDNSKK